MNLGCFIHGDFNIGNIYLNFLKLQNLIDASGERIILRYRTWQLNPIAFTCLAIGDRGNVL